MTDYQPEMNPDEELYSEDELALSELAFRQERVAEWADVRSAVPRDEGRVAEYRRQMVEDGIRRGVAQAERGEVRPAPCPDDTNGDGDCGKRWCPHCGGVLRWGQAPPVLTASFQEFCRDARVVFDPVSACETAPYESVARFRQAVEDERHKLYADFLLVKRWGRGEEEKFDGLGQLLSILENRECGGCGAQGGGHVHECPIGP